MGVTTVLDFGGACGVHYKEAILHTPDVRWAVVETPAMVDRASELASDRLKFFTSIATASYWLGSIDLMHSNGALQYAADPKNVVSELCAARATRMYWRRLVFSQGATVREMQGSFLADNGPGTADSVEEKRVEYCRTRIPEQTFIDAHSARYRLVDRGKDWFRFDRN
jgi:putative methyltransferase (TIGR04325 family)